MTGNYDEFKLNHHLVVGNAVLGGPVGRVSPEQAGILPTGPVRISHDMLARAIVAAPDVAPEKVRAILEAALRG